MIDLRQFRETPDRVRQGLARRGDNAAAHLIDQILELDARRREAVTAADAQKAERNAASQRVAKLKKTGSDIQAATRELKALSQGIKTLDEQIRHLEAELQQRLLRVPNLTLEDVPPGDATANVEVRAWGERPTFSFAPRPHWELGETLRILDMAAGAKLTGSGFPVLRGPGARLSRALATFMLDLHIREHGYIEAATPYLVAREMLLGTGQLPKFEDDLYRTSDDLFLIPTAEVTLTNLHRNEILAARDLPLGYTAWTPCFRREAGAHGKDTRGINRVHQFDKVELVRLVQPEEASREHELLTSHAEAVLQRLGLAYRVILLASGDTGFASAKTYDLEVWAPGQKAWLEVSSSSTFGDFQARRANIRYRPAPGAKPDFVHTLNASGLAFPRTLIALLETYQEEDGSVRLPEPLAVVYGADRIVAGDAK